MALRLQLLSKNNNPTLPIIAFTADAMPETHAKAFEHGMCDYLTKPFVPEDLFEQNIKALQTCDPAEYLSGFRVPANLLRFCCH
jgi:CheY-like chemotaxis protein